MVRLRTLGVCLASLLVIAAAAAGAAQATTLGAASWGEGAHGQLGNGSTLSSDSPGAVSALTGVASVSAGGNHSLALLSNGTVMAWGENGDGQLGDGNTTSSDVPVAVSGLSGVVAVSAGGEHSLALLGNGTVMAWGDNGNGQLGNDSINNSDVPVAVSGLTGVTAVAAGDYHSLALLSNGTVMAWGNDVEGQLGNGITANGELTPVAVSSLTEVKGISAGGLHSLAVLRSGAVMAWGENANGELGNGTTTNSDVPVAVSGLTGATAVSAGGHHSLALLSNGTAEAWGDNGKGQLGNGTTTSSDVPVAVSGLTGATALSAGGHHSLARLSNGKVDAWGENTDGQLGDGSTGSSDVPVPVSGLNEVQSIAAGSLHSLASGPELPIVTGVAPSEGPHSGGDTVTITGSSYVSVTGVFFGGAAAKSYEVKSPASITAVAPAGTGIVDVTVSTVSGSSGHGASDHYSYLPEVLSLSPGTGPQAGGTPVTITGANLYEVTAVKFGGSSAKSYEVKSPTTIDAVAPAGAGVVDVTVTDAGGTSATGSFDHFTYSGVAPEFGRCVKVTHGTGAFGNSGCTVAGGKKGYEWMPGPGAKPQFTTKLKTGFSSTTLGGNSITCKTEKGAGEYTGPKAVGNVVLSFGACAFGGAKCTSAGAVEGDIVTHTLSGELGIVKAGTEGAASDELGLDLRAASGSALAEFSCGGVAVAWRGAVITPLLSDRMLVSATLKFSAPKDHQVPEQFEGGPRDVIETSIGGGPFEQAGWTITTSVTNHEGIDANAVV